MSPSNSLTAAEAYCAKLRLPEAARADLLAAAANAADPLAEVHRLLAGAGFDPANPAFGSIAPRLKMALDGATRRGEEMDSKAFTEDLQGRVRLASMPPLKRASFTSRPWSPNPLKALMRSIGRLLLGNRGQFRGAVQRLGHRLKPVEQFVEILGPAGQSGALQVTGDRIGNGGACGAGEPALQRVQILTTGHFRSVGILHHECHPQMGRQLVEIERIDGHQHPGAPA